MESPFKADVLKGKVVLITGGGSGIGFEISTQFGRHGAAVAIMGRRPPVRGDSGEPPCAHPKDLFYGLFTWDCRIATDQAKPLIYFVGSKYVIMCNILSYISLIRLQAIGVEGDVRKQEDAARVVEETFKHFGKLDILVNGAAGNFLVSPEDLSPNGFRTGSCFLWHFRCNTQ
ncbi:hypothetical protein BHM03_00003454 [Ensete ventricosum]|nr:hypothetical protein BHM03_00003454 [Ensete ventricosum]